MASVIKLTPARYPYSYFLGGLKVLSQIRLSGIVEAPSSGLSPTVDIIQRAPSDSEPFRSGTSSLYEHSDQRSVIHIPSVATYEVTSGTRIDVSPNAAATAKDIEIFLCGVAWATLCHQRGVLPLHASAVSTPSGIIAFMGPSGTGKSTTAAQMGLNGYDLVTDDVLPVTLDSSRRPGAWPYLRRLKLKADALERLGLSGTEPVSERLDSTKSFVLPSTSVSRSWRPLQSIFLLDQETEELEPRAVQLTASDALVELVRNTYHFEFVRRTKALGPHLAACGRIASLVPVYRLEGRHRATADEIASLVAKNSPGEAEKVKRLVVGRRYGGTERARAPEPDAPGGAQ